MGQALAKWTQKGSVTEYIVGFLEWFIQCTDVNEVEALFSLVEGLPTNIQAWVHTQSPSNLQSAMQMAK